MKSFLLKLSRTLSVLLLITVFLIPELCVHAQIRVPVASGTVTYQNANAVVDASNASAGYVMVKYNGSGEKIKVQISKSGSETYTYDLNASGRYEVFPLSEGNGSYTIKVFKNVSGNQYAQVLSQSISVQLVSETEPFLYPNQFCNFSAQSAIVPVAQQLTAGITDQLAQVAAIYNYVVDNFTYDDNKARNVQSGYLPNVDQILAAKTGICFDYAAVMTSMLRAKEIPTKLVVGYAGSAYHAWVSVYINGTGWIDNIIYFDGQNWKLMDPTFASSSHRNKSVMEFIGNGTNYKKKFAY